MTTVEVFRTNVLTEAQASRVLRTLNERFPDYKVNFDLEDCDKVLRVESKSICIETIVALVTERGFACNVLE
jgi:hypothetical protein